MNAAAADPRMALLARYFAKRHRGAWFRSAAYVLVRELRAERKP